MKMKYRILTMIGLSCLIALAGTSIYLVANVGVSANSISPTTSTGTDIQIGAINLNKEEKITTLKNPKNQKLSFNNLKSSTQKTSNTLNHLISFIDKIEDSQLGSEDLKKDFHSFKNKLDDLSKKISIHENYKNSLNSNQNTSEKISDLDIDDLDYKERLLEIKNELMEISNELKLFFISSFQDTNDVEGKKDLLKDYNNLETLKKTFTTLKGKIPPNFLNLLHAFKSDKDAIVDFLGTFKNLNDKDEFYKVLRTVVQIISLRLRRQLQTVAISLLIEENVSEEKLMLSFNKLSNLHATKVKQAQQSSEFINDIYGLEKQLVAIEKNITDILQIHYSNNRTKNSKIFDKIRIILSEFKNYKKLYFGFYKTDINIRKIIRPGIKKIVQNLEKSINNLSTKSIKSVKAFNSFYQNSLFSSKQAEGFFLAWINFSNFSVKNIKNPILDLHNELLSKVSRGDNSSEENDVLLDEITSLKALIEKLEQNIQDINNGSLANVKNHNSKVENYDSSIYSLSNFTEKYLLQAAIDNLDFFSQLYSLEDISVIF